MIKAQDNAGVEKTFDYADQEVSIEPANGTVLTEAGDFEAEVSLTIDGVKKTASFNYHVDERTITTYVKATSQTFENALLGSKVLLGYGSNVNGAWNGKEYLLATSVDADVQNSDHIVIHEDSAAVPLTLSLGYVSDSFSLYYDDGSTKGYLAISGKNVIIGDRNGESHAKTASFGITVGSDGKSKINSKSSSSYFLEYNAFSPRFKFYEDTQEEPYLFLSAPTAEEQVKELATYIMAWDEENQCETHYGVAKNAFINRLDSEAQEIFKTTTGDASEEVGIVAQAKARYDAWAINRGDYETRFDGNAPSGAAIVKGDANDDMGIYVGVLAIVLAGLGVGSAVIIKKRKSRI